MLPGQVVELPAHRWRDADGPPAGIFSEPRSVQTRAQRRQVLTQVFDLAAQRRGIDINTRARVLTIRNIHAPGQAQQACGEADREVRTAPQYGSSP